MAERKAGNHLLNLPPKILPMDYDSLLKRGLDRVPKDIEGSGRFHLAKPDIEKAGAKTIITNFLEIAGSLRRNPDILFKFLLQQLATKFGSLPEETTFRVQAMESLDELDRYFGRVLSANSLDEMGLGNSAG